MKVSGESDSSVQFFVNNSKMAVKYIYSLSVWNYLHADYKIRTNKQCINGTTTIVYVPYPDSKSSLYYFFRKN